MKQQAPSIEDHRYVYFFFPSSRCHIPANSSCLGRDKGQCMKPLKCRGFALHCITHSAQLVTRLFKYRFFYLDYSAWRGVV